jgi:hypothetical protein
MTLVQKREGRDGPGYTYCESRGSRLGLERRTFRLEGVQRHCCAKSEDTEEMPTRGLAARSPPQSTATTTTADITVHYESMPSTVSCLSTLVISSRTNLAEAHIIGGPLHMLECLPPMTTTRANEFIPENIAFMLQIVDNWLASSRAAQCISRWTRGEAGAEHAEYEVGEGGRITRLCRGR